MRATWDGCKTQNEPPRSAYDLTKYKDQLETKGAKLGKEHYDETDVREYEFEEKHWLDENADLDERRW